MGRRCRVPLLAGLGRIMCMQSRFGRLTGACVTYGRQPSTPPEPPAEQTPSPFYGYRRHIC